MAIGKKGFTLLETLVAALVLTVIGSAIAGVYVMEGALLSHTSHRLDAINYARGVADTLAEKAKNTTTGRSSFYRYKYPPGELSAGLHTENSDPEICKLPRCFFRDKLDGRIKYRVEDVTLTGGVNGRKVEVSVEWVEKFPKRKSKSEKLDTLVTFYPSYYSNW